MWTTEYVREIKKALRDQHHLEPTRVVEGEPHFDDLHNGDYPMVIAGRLDRVRVVNGRFECCRFDEPVPRAAARCRYEMWCNDSKGRPRLLGWGNDPKEFAQIVAKWPGKSTFRAIDLRRTEQDHRLISQG